MYICICVYVYAYMCIYIYIYIHIHTCVLYIYIYIYIICCRSQQGLPRQRKIGSARYDVCSQDLYGEKMFVLEKMFSRTCLFSARYDVWLDTI